MIVIRRGSNRLHLYLGMRLGRASASRRASPSIRRRRGCSIVVMRRNPWWYPPDSAWAKRLDAVPPGRQSARHALDGSVRPGVGIHGTPDDASIGYSASHGCIRMHIRDAEWVFHHVKIGTPVFIVATLENITARLLFGAQALSVALVIGLLALLIWKVAHPKPAPPTSPRTWRKGETPQSA